VKKEHIKHHLSSSICSSGESTELYSITWLETGETEIKLKHTVSQSFPTQDLEKAEKLFEQLTGGNGRRVLKPEDLVNL